MSASSCSVTAIADPRVFAVAPVVLHGRPGARGRPDSGADAVGYGGTYPVFWIDRFCASLMPPLPAKAGPIV
ncbi:MAG TPA: hypothetical protein VF516_32245 [Kofleriaceae bacterium]